VGLSVKSGMAGVEVEYAIVKDYCKKYALESIDTFAMVRYIAKKVYAKKE